VQKTEALAAFERIDVLIRYFGGPDETSRTEFKRLTSGLRDGPIGDAYFREKLSRLDHWADEGFSTRKYAKYSGGLQAVQVWADGSLSTARSLVEEYWPD
jgi:hypothetical protein